MLPHFWCRIHDMCCEYTAATRAFMGFGEAFLSCYSR